MSDPRVAEVGRAAERLLSGAAPAPFSRSGFRRLRESIDDFVDAVTDEAYRISNRARADTVSAAHVDEAVKHLVAQRSRSVFRHLGAIGGILLGSAVSQLITMLSDAKFTPLGVSLTAVLGVVGAFLVALHMARD